MFFTIILDIFLYLVGLFILWHVIRSAVDDSQLACDIRKISEILCKMYPEADDNKHISEEDCVTEDVKINECPVNECPACHAEIPQDARECPSCGLALIIDEDET